MTRRSTGPGAVLVLAVAAVLAACSSSTAPAPAATPSSGSVAGARAEAKASGADPSQLALFDDGAISYSDYETAINRYASCARDAGYQVTMSGTRASQGVTLLDYTLTVPTGKTSALADACYDKFAKFVDMYWQTSSPDAKAFSDRREKALAPQLHDCLTRYKVDVPGDASFDEMVKASVDHVQKNQSQDCMNEIGYGAWQG